jgi:hypothetical protein
MATNVRENVMVFIILLNTLETIPKMKIVDSSIVNSKIVLLKSERIKSDTEIISFTLGSRECTKLS